MASDYQKIMYKDYENILAQVNALAAELKNAQIKHDYEMNELKAQHQDEMRKLEEELAKRDEIIEDQQKRIAKLEEDNSRMRSILDNDSHNSSNPPSSDQKPSGKAPNEYNSRKKSERKQGAQKGHAGRTLTVADVREILASGESKHIVKTIGVKNGVYISRYILDMKVIPVVTEYRIYPNRQGKYTIPTWLSANVTYGHSIKAMAVALYGIGVMANERIAEFIQNITNSHIKIAAGTVYGFCRSFSELAEKEIKTYEERLLNSKTNYTDATVISIDGVQGYIRNVSNADTVCYYAMSKKTTEELKKIRVLEDYCGTLEHDHETTLYRFGCRHAECNVHLDRYLKKNSEDTGNHWSKDMSELFNDMNLQRHFAKEQGQNSLEDVVLSEFEKRYDAILEKGRTENTMTKVKWAKQEEKALLNRLVKYKANHLLFIHDFSVEYSNNLSERDLRKCKNRQKMAGGFRNIDGCNMYCRIMSVIETAKRRGINSYSAIQKILSLAN